MDARVTDWHSLARAKRAIVARIISAKRTNHATRRCNGTPGGIESVPTTGHPSPIFPADWRDTRKCVRQVGCHRRRLGRRRHRSISWGKLGGMRYKAAERRPMSPGRQAQPSAIGAKGPGMARPTLQVLPLRMQSLSKSIEAARHRRRKRSWLMQDTREKCSDYQKLALPLLPSCP